MITPFNSDIDLLVSHVTNIYYLSFVAKYNRINHKVTAAGTINIANLKNISKFILVLLSVLLK
jgi:hypothetical protein